MGDIIPFRPKALVEFEKSAAKLVANGSRFMADVPAAIRVARHLGDHELLRRISELIIPLSALVNCVGVLEEHAGEICEAIPQGQRVIVTIANASEVHNVKCQAEVRSKVIYVSAFALQPRNRIDGPAQAAPSILIEFVA